MIDISLHKITKNYGFGDILKDISLEINKGEKIALIGENGCGKTTILKMINEIEKPTTGQISIRKNASIGYLSQIPEIKDNNLKVKDLLYKCIDNIISIQQALKNYEEKMSRAQGKELEKLIIKYTNLQKNL